MFVYDNVTPYYYEGNESTWSSMATIGTMIIPPQLLSRSNRTLPYGEPNSMYYYPDGMLQLRSFP